MPNEQAMQPKEKPKYFCPGMAAITTRQAED
jgi:hypothetical protein